MSPLCLQLVPTILMHKRAADSVGSLSPLFGRGEGGPRMCVASSTIIVDARTVSCFAVLVRPVCAPPELPADAAVPARGVPMSLRINGQAGQT
jgi:hypothetical protein